VDRRGRLSAVGSSGTQRSAVRVRPTRFQRVPRRRHGCRGALRVYAILGTSAFCPVSIYGASANPQCTMKYVSGVATPCIETGRK
jgi:hypothetical protein